MIRDIEKFDNFLDEESFKIVQETAFRHLGPRSSTTFRTNYTVWSDNIINQSSAVLVYDVKEENVIKILDDECMKRFDKTPFNYMFYYWTNNSFIPWHEDGHVSNAGTLYLNDEWNKDFGGLYLYETVENEIKALVPTRNTYIFQYNHTKHATTPTYPGTPFRVSVQMFFA